MDTERTPGRPPQEAQRVSCLPCSQMFFEELENLLDDWRSLIWTV